MIIVQTPRTSPARPAAAFRLARSAKPFVVITILIFGLSGGLLWTLGYNYDATGGSSWDKIHPSTYLILATFAWNAISFGNPVGFAVRTATLRPGSLLLLVIGLVLFLIKIARSAPGMAGTIDTFVAPPLLTALLLDIEERGMQRVATTLHVMMTANALVGIAELVADQRFFPYRFNGLLLVGEVRSTALLGHPLTNAAVTACYVLALISAARNLSGAMKLPLIVLQFTALVAFGGRTASVVVPCLALVYLIILVHRAMCAGRIPLLGAAVGVILLGLVPLATGVLASAGFFDVLIERFTNDPSSNKARLEMFAMFNQLSFRDLLFGPDLGMVNSLRTNNGLELGIENPVIAALLYQGVLLTLMLAAAVFAFLREITRRCSRGIWLPMVGFIVLLNAAETIATKSLLLSQFAIIALSLCGSERSGWRD